MLFGPRLSLGELHPELRQRTFQGGHSLAQQSDLAVLIDQIRLDRDRKGAVIVEYEGLRDPQGKPKPVSYVVRFF